METLKNIAQELGAADAVRRLIAAEALPARSGTRIAVIGPVNSGKTTLINGVLGQEVRSPSPVPSDGLPLRVTFDRTAEDGRFDCESVFHREWGATDALLYEFSADRLWRDESLADEADMAFCLFPLSRFMTADDKKTVALLDGIPVRIIATQCDRVAAEDLEQAMEFAEKTCRRMALPAPLFAGPDRWESVSDGMRRAIPASAELAGLRRTHREKIVESCRLSLLDCVNRRIAGEEGERKALRAQREAAERRERLAAVTANRVYQEMRLRCSTAANDRAAQVRGIIQALDAFARQTAEEGRRCKFDAAFRERAGRQAESLLGGQLEALEAQIRADVNAITADAAAAGMLSAEELGALRQSVRLPAGDGSGVRFDQNSGNEVSYLLQSVAGVGAVSAVALLSRVPTPLSVGLIAASTVAGGAAFFVRNTLSRTARNEASVLGWARACAEALRTETIPAVQRIYAELADALHPSAAPVRAEAPAENEALDRLRTLADMLGA